ncbi:MAG TPA: hypothetical protein VLN59_02340 [Burkholderiales bacterium]|nr:hypothetical protein [Burkholderiales bacterium]
MAQASRQESFDRRNSARRRFLAQLTAAGTMVVGAGVMPAFAQENLRERP